jgi:class 3 adenylate cyclase
MEDKVLFDTQISTRYLAVIEEQIQIYREGTSVQVRNEIPPTTEIPIENPHHWLKIPDVICVFVDMQGSTLFSTQTQEKSTAAAFQLYTGTAVRLFSEFESPYIDVRGDGVFALFNSNQAHRAFASAITFKSFANEVFVPKIRHETGVNVGSHIGIDQKTVLVRKLGLKRHGDRSDRQNEVWAGKTVNMAAKLASLGENDEVLVSDRFFDKLSSPLVRMSCGCPSGVKKGLWSERDVTSTGFFDFEKTYSLQSSWCQRHGKDYCEAIIALDDEQ